MNLYHGATNKTVLDRFMALDITASKKVTFLIFITISIGISLYYFFHLDSMYVHLD